MKNLKRLIALVAVFALALTTIASAATFSDVTEDSAYYEAVETLTKLGIIDGYEDGTFKPEQTVTRAEMAKLLAAVQGYGSSAESQTSTAFSDVPATHWASGYIANATGVAIDGYEDGTFRPDVQVKYEEAVKMIMATLGYTVIANGNGGYPMGYVTAAIKAKVTDGVSNATVGTYANRGTIAQLLFNAIDTPLVEQTTWEKDGSGDYTKFDGTGNNAYKTLMSEYLDVVKMKGVVVANSYMNIKETVDTIDKEDDPTVKIDITNTYKVVNDEFYDGYDYAQNYEFLVGDSDAEDFVGKAVIFFAKENDYDDWEIISIAEDSTYNTSVTFPLADFDEDDTTDDSIYYYKNGSTTGTKLKLEETVNVLYNNAYYAGGDLVALITRLANGNFGGQVTLVDTNKTSGYDLAVVEAAVSAVVEEVVGKKINLKETVNLPNSGRVARIDTNDDDVIVVLTKDGKEITASDVNEGDVLSIVSVNNAVYTVVDVMSNVVEGTVSSRKASSTSSNGYAYKIDGTWYDVAAGADIGTVAAGDAGNFYIDKYGYIAYYDETVAGSTGTYGYVLDALVDVDSWDNQTFEIKMLTSEGVKTYQAADKFTIYPAVGEKYTKDVDDLDKDTYSDEFLDDYGAAVIDYSLSGGKISKIYAAGYDEDKFAVVGTISGNYDASSYEIGRTTFEKDTVVFYVDQRSESKSYVGTLADLEDDVAITGAKAYENSKNTEDANILVLYNMGTSTSASSGMAVITEIEDGSDEDGDDIYVLTVLYNGEEVTLSTDADVYTAHHDGITVGDIVKLKVNGNNVITALALVYDFAEDVRDKYTSLNVADKYVYSAPALEAFDGGYALAYNATGRKVTLFNGKPYKLSDCKNVYVIDNTGRKIDFYVGSASDFAFDKNLIDTGDWTEADIVLNNGDTVEPADVADIVIFRQYDGKTVEAVIIKGLDNGDYDID